MESESKKYFWLKLHRDFFKRHDTRIIESMENGKDYLLFYLKLLVESVDHNGNLRFSDTIPYNDLMLATITGTNVDIVRSAVKILCELGLMTRMDDGTLFMDAVEKMVGSETFEAERKRNSRKKKELESRATMSGQFPTKSDKFDKSKSKSKSKREESDASSPQYRLSKLLYDEHLKSDPKFLSGKNLEETFQRWSVDIERLLRIDCRSEDEVRGVIVWCQSDQFWKGNILSGAKLREKFATLFVQKGSKPVKPVDDDVHLMDLDSMKDTLEGLARTGNYD